MIVALNLAKGPARVPIPADLPGTAERLYGEARWAAAPGGPHLELPGESAAVFRLKGRGVVEPGSPGPSRPARRPVPAGPSARFIGSGTAGAGLVPARR